MNNILQTNFRLSCCSKASEEQIKLSVVIRTTLFVIGALTFLVGCLALSNVPGLNRLGTAGGWTTVGIGATIALSTLAIMQVSKRLPPKPAKKTIRTTAPAVKKTKVKPKPPSTTPASDEPQQQNDTIASPPKEEETARTPCNEPKTYDTIFSFLDGVDAIKRRVKPTTDSKFDMSEGLSPDELPKDLNISGTVPTESDNLKQETEADLLAEQLKALEQDFENDFKESF